MAEVQSLWEKQNTDDKRFHPAVELLIPVYHPKEELDQLLCRMRKQSYAPAGIHLLVTASEDEFSRIRGKYDGDGMICLTRIEPEEFDHGGTRHLGASGSRADILLFMTQDAVPDDEYLVEKLVQALGYEAAGDGNGESAAWAAKDGSPVIAAAYARQLPAADCGPIERYTRQFNYPDKDRIKTAEDLPALGIKTYFCSNVCAAYRRDIYEKLGGFERRTIFNEDMIFAAGLIGAGYGIAYAADARVIHSHNYSGAEQLHRNFDLAVSQADHPEIFEGVPSEGEGIRMVKATAGYLCRTGRWYLLPKLVWQSGCKYLGYLLGKRYRKLPRAVVLGLTMNRRYWQQDACPDVSRDRQQDRQKD